MNDEDKKQAYQHLCDRVRYFDFAAAAWMENEAPKLGEDDFNYAYYLSGAFSWKNTPQGFAFWYGMQQLIEKEPDKFISLDKQEKHND